MHAFGKILCRGGDSSDKWPLNRVYDRIPRKPSQRGKHGWVVRESGLFALSLFTPLLAFRRVPSDSVHFVDIRRNSKQLPAEVFPAVSAGRVGWTPETPFWWIFKPPRGKSAKESRASAHPPVCNSRDFPLILLGHAFGITHGRRVYVSDKSIALDKSSAYVIPLGANTRNGARYGRGVLI